MRRRYARRVAGVERRVSRATSPQIADAWVFAIRSSWLNPSHPDSKKGKLASRHGWPEKLNTPWPLPASDSRASNLHCLAEAKALWI